MDQIHIDVLKPAVEISKALSAWFDENLPIDIRICRGVEKGRKVVRFSIYGSTQENIKAKWDALEKLLKK